MHNNWARSSLPAGVVFDKERHSFQQIQQLQFMAAAVPPGSTCTGGGVASYPISSRLTRLMTVISFFPLSSDTLEGIYSSVFQAWLEEFPAYSLTHHELLAKVRKWMVVLSDNGCVFLQKMYFFALIWLSFLPSKMQPLCVDYKKAEANETRVNICWLAGAIFRQQLVDWFLSTLHDSRYYFVDQQVVT